METISENLFVLRFPMRLGGTEIGRTSTLIRLSSGEVIIHSSAPFSETDLAAIRRLGPVAGLIDATLFHETYAATAARLFPATPYYAPPGFEMVSKIRSLPFHAMPPLWKTELEIIPLEGMPRVNEHAIFHRQSRTLIICDLLFNLERPAPWTAFFFRYVAGISEYPGMSRIFRSFIKDRPAFQRSVQEILKQDFQRIIVAHGATIEDGARTKLIRALEKDSLLPS